MPQRSPRVDMPYLQPSQAQKHVTHNEALQRLDAVTQLCLQGFSETVPPESPVAGEIYGLGAAPGGAWSGQDGMLAYWDGAAWLFLPPREGWRAWGRAEQELRIWRAQSWQAPFDRIDGLTGLGVGTTADAVNRLSVVADASLLSHAGAGHQLKLNKAAMGDTASLLFQSDWSGHAEMGLAGDNSFTVKLSPDGQSWQDMLRADPAAGEVTLSPAGTARLVLGDAGLQLDVPVSGAAVQTSGADGSDDRLLKTGAYCLTDGNTQIAGALDGLSGSWLGGYSGKTDGPVALTGSADDGHGLLLQSQRADDRRHRIFQTLSGQLFHQHETGDGLQTPRRVIDTGNLLGPVSQSGGAPTGAVIERGSNANGTYIRLADGTQICGVSALHNAALAAESEISGSWNFPASFSGNPMFVSANIRSTGGATTTAAAARYLSAAASIESYSFCSWGAYNGRSSAFTTVRVDLLAIGQWY